MKTGHLNYPGDATETVGSAIGPDQNGRFYLIEDVVYDAEADRSRATVAEVEMTPALAQRTLDEIGRPARAAR